MSMQERIALETIPALRGHETSAMVLSDPAKPRGGAMKLYSYFRSSAAYRVRIALNFKDIAYDIIPVHLLKDGGRHKSADYRAVNPQMRVPALELPGGEVLVQSLAIINYLEEAFPEPPL